MDFIEGAAFDTLQFIIAGYGNKMAYHKYIIEENRLTPGQPMTVESIREIFKFVNDLGTQSSFQFKGIIPDNVLSFRTDEKFIVWYTPPTKKQLYYPEKCPIASGVYPVPGLVWVLRDHSLTLFASKGKPTKEKDKLFQAPFFNINGGGSVCMGSAKFVSNSQHYEDIIKQVEEGFYNSRFTHSSTNNLLNGNFTELSNTLINSDAIKEDLLVEVNVKLKDVLKWKNQ